MDPDWWKMNTGMGELTLFCWNVSGTGPFHFNGTGTVVVGNVNKFERVKYLFRLMQIRREFRIAVFN